MTDQQNPEQTPAEPQLTETPQNLEMPLRPANRIRAATAADPVSRETYRPALQADPQTDLQAVYQAEHITPTPPSDMTLEQVFDALLPAKTEVLYSTLLDESELAKRSLAVNPTTQNAVPDGTIVYDSLPIVPEPINPHPEPSHFVQPIRPHRPFDDDLIQTQNQDTPPASASIVQSVTATVQPDPSQPDTLLITEDILSKTPKAATLTDQAILSQSQQLIAHDDRLADDTTHQGVLIEQLTNSRHWLLSLNWEQTAVPKAGLLAKFKKTTELLDLDLSCLLCNRYGEVLERVWFKQVRDQAESVRHQGDELAGTPITLGESATTPPVQAPDDPRYHQERIALYLAKIPPHIFHVAMVATSYQRQPLTLAKAARYRLTDDGGRLISELAFDQLPNGTRQARANALWLTTLTRFGDSWRFNVNHQPLSVGSIAELDRHISEHLRRSAR